ncbi:hypothetical protein D9V34_08715 [Mycetocola lacteus]|uniref:Uncharacterized protein n=1 Tax=Mycetocola lacteus TaxID=76637 RepID=A0A3L7ATI2_9MICO|nr:hypothetical protein [Mycetocola lacteus]RLP83295.1 hypothetical protein D9V34_08715 [Mycetocola lacteus]
MDNHFARQPLGAVSFAAIARGDGPEILGYFWFSDQEAAAGYVTRRACDPDGYNAGAVWNEYLNRGYLGGEAPSQTYGSLIDENFGHRIGRIDSGSLRRIESLAELRELAALP